MTEPLVQALRSRGYHSDGASFPTGRPDRATLALVTRAGIPVVAKLYSSGGGATTYANMQELWRSSFGERRRPPGLPQPIEYLPDVGRGRCARGGRHAGPCWTGWWPGMSPCGPMLRSRLG